ncbi:LLM class flavin-dependent oxidoreductase [Nocardioides houyundeii]|uniref:LLM class flavin-dependent oxidoreductase n=1 Tax=Nocardioides houyundeii TaxID=2045452 RepID=UPI000DF32E25|nr:LLM class flavin-dependent oxidoreductase [Nocardioides houyundeii]
MASTSSDVRFGLMLAAQFEQGIDPVPKMRDSIEQVVASREGDFDSIWTVQHFLADFQYFQPVPLLARLAAEAGDMHLGTGILLVPHYPPVLLAEELATLSVLTQGRFILGAGAGYREQEFSAIGVPHKERYGRLEESIELMRKLWSGDPVDHVGKFYEVSDVQMSLLPPQRQDLPVWIGATGPVGIRRAARIGNEWIATGELTISDIRTGQERFIEASPKDPADHCFPLVREVLVAESSQEARRHAEGALRQKYANYEKWGHPSRPIDELLDGVIAVGSPQECLESIAGVLEQTRSRYLILRMQWPSSEHAATMRSIELFGEHVAPELKKAFGTKENGGDH